MGSRQSWHVNEEGTSATTVLKPTDFKGVDNGYEIRYSNDGGVSYVRSGVKVSYDTGFSAEEQAVITGVEIKVRENTYGNS